MDSNEKQRLENLALKRLHATADEEEEHSFLFRTEGALDYAFYPWSRIEHEDFDGDAECVKHIWGSDRLALVESGEADPTEEELLQWCRATALSRAANTDWAWVAWVVPIWECSTISGYALFLCEPDPDHDPELRGVYKTLAEAQQALALEGAVYGSDGATRLAVGT